MLQIYVRPLNELEPAFKFSRTPYDEDQDGDDDVLG